MSRKSDNVKAWRKRTKERLVKAFGDKCAICKKEYPSELFDFHHVNKDDKKFSLGSVRGSIRSWKKIVDEVKKCIMLCSNCHRLVEYNYKEIPINAKRFDESFTEYVKVSSLEQYAYHNCPICGSNKVHRNHTYCSNICSAKARRKVKDRPSITELIKMVKENGYVSTGKEFGVTDNTIRKWIKHKK
jgi:predicted RNA-binding Zn-ribbon protein involved in translation (DUF1610 family)